MDATTATPRHAAPRPKARGAKLPAVDLQAIAVWLLGFALPVYLALNGGGYDPILRNQLGIAVWWGLLLGIAVGALPLSRLRRGPWIALGLLAAYVAWVALSATWSRSAEQSFEDVGLVVTLLGVFSLALAIRSNHGARRMVSAVGCGIAVVAVVALLSRLHPAWFPDARQTIALLGESRNRLAYPLGYWNGVAALVALGLPLIAYLATSARRAAVQALAAAALPAMALTIYFTFSRGGTLAALFALALFLALVPDRLPKLTTLLLAAAGAAILIAAAHQRTALNEGLGSALAHRQGDQLLLITLAVCAAVGLLQAGLALALRRGARPAWTKPSRRFTAISLGAAAAVLVVVAVAAGGPAKTSHAWHEFKAAKGTAHGSARFESFSSNGRWPLWEASLHEAGSAPLAGTGSGTFESWWLQHRPANGGFVRDAHSLYFETLGELGVVGLALLISFLGWVLVAGARRYRGASRHRRAQLAAALAACGAFCLGAAYDWLWQIAVIPLAFLLLASVLVSAGDRPRRRPLPLGARLGGVAVAAAAIVAIAIPLSTASSIQQSQRQFRAGDLRAALNDAEDARRVEPFAAVPRLQQALVLEASDDLVAAAGAARAATSREPDDWAAWLILSRLEARRGQARAALAAYRRARSLNPRSSLFAR